MCFFKEQKTIFLFKVVLAVAFRNVNIFSFSIIATLALLKVRQVKYLLFFVLFSLFYVIL